MEMFFYYCGMINQSICAVTLVIQATQTECTILHVFAKLCKEHWPKPQTQLADWTMKQQQCSDEVIPLFSLLSPSISIFNGW